MRFLLLCLLFPLALLAQSQEFTLRGAASELALGEHVNVTVTFLDSKGAPLIVKDEVRSATPRARPSLASSRQGYAENFSATTASPLRNDATTYANTISRLLLRAWVGEPRPEGSTATGVHLRCTLSIDMTSGATTLESAVKGDGPVTTRLTQVLAKFTLPKPPVLVARAIGPTSRLLVSVISFAPGTPLPSGTAADKTRSGGPGTTPDQETPDVKEPRKKNPNMRFDVDLLPGQSQ